MTQQLRCADLRGGDILLKLNAGSLTNRIINTGQKLAGASNPDVVHAGILFDSTYIIESSGPGLIASDLRVKDRPYAYYVFRCTNTNVAAGAATCAKMMFDIQGRTGNLTYTAAGAAASAFGASGKPKTAGDMDALLDRILQGKSTPFFCSQFVVFVYQFVAEQNGLSAATVFDYSDAKSPPSKVAASLVANALFVEAGYLVPNER